MSNKPIRLIEEQHHDEEEQAWITDAYKDFKERITKKYLITNNVKSFKAVQDALKMIPGNSSQLYIDLRKFPLCCPFWYIFSAVFVVQSKHFALVTCDEGKVKKTEIYGPGYHVLGYYKSLQGIYSFEKFDLITSSIGDLKIAKVEQGTIMHFEFGGQNIILGPGIHLITESLAFLKKVSLDAFYIEIGPEKWVTVPDGYDGISINRGSLRILEGGHQHHLSHVSDNFVKMIPKTLLTDRVPTDIPTYIQKSSEGGLNLKQQNDNDLAYFLQATTLDGSSVILDTMIFWRITNSYLAATTAMEILVVDNNGTNKTSDLTEHQVIKSAQNNISKLRTTLLRIAKHHLTKMVGKCSLAGQVSLETQYLEKQNLQDGNVEESKILLQSQNEVRENLEKHSFEILNVLQKSSKSLKDTINDELAQIGAHMDNMCIYSVRPTNEIQMELDKQTKARVDGNTAIISVTAKKQVTDVELQIDTKTALIKARINSDVQIIQAKAGADCEIIKTEGQANAIKKVASARRVESQKLQEYSLAVDLAKLRLSGDVGQKIFSGTSSNYVYGTNPGEVINNMIKDMGKKN